jgi:predicted amidohydrolase
MQADSSYFKAAAIQMSCIPGDVAANIAKAERLVNSAVDQGAKLIVLPELFNTGYRVEDQDTELAECIPGATTEWLTQIAAKHQIYLSAAILESSKSDGLVYDTAVLIGSDGVIGTYRKTHLWEREQFRFGSGREFSVFESGLGKIGLQICYEVGFPEGARILAMRGADILLYPSAFGKARSYAWDIATRSRALENGVFVIAANRSGMEQGGTIFNGCSRIIDPSGTVLAEAVDEDEVIVAQIDLEHVNKQRGMIPYLKDMNKKLFVKHYMDS